jgi:isopenicillin-N epimerase
MLSEWLLDPEFTYLNHGTVGAVPRRVLAAQQVIRDRIERHPARFMLRDLVSLVGVPPDGPGQLRQAAATVAAFLGAAASDFVFVDNVTTGVNAVLRSVDLAAGDEVILTDHSYGAIARAAEFATRERGASVRTVPMPYPAFDPDVLVDLVDRAIGPRTRLILVDHITSESALVLPVAAIAARARARHVLTLIDGAHAPGVLDLDLPSLGVDFYSANLHKWAHAPRSCGFLWAAPAQQARLHPPVISWGLDAGFTAEFDWVGTRDASPYLAAPEGIAFLRELGPAGRAWNHDLACRAARELPPRWGTTFEAGEASIGSMATLPLPESFGDSRDAAARLRDALFFEHKIEVQVHPGYGRLWVRVCAQVYNEWADFERLSSAIK